jgi:hypothetical protein
MCPINYDRYPLTWKTEIRPAVLERAGNKCEDCGLENGSIVWAVKFKGRTTGWFKFKHEAEQQPRTYEIKKGKYVDNPKEVKVVLTVAHLDHDETNHDVKIDRLRAWCQLCHLRYDAKEKHRRIMSK